MDQAERTTLIRTLVAKAQPQLSAPWRGGSIRLPVVTVDIDLPIYRLANGRLAADLKEAAARGEAINGAEGAPETQRALGDLLLAKARDQRGPIHDELARIAVQTEPLLLSASGVVINGNRRLAAMRALLASDPKRYASFARISAAVLPKDATKEDLETVEAALQMAPETKLAYTWISRRLKLRQQRDELGMSVAAICEASRLDGPPQLDRELAELALAEDYLETYCGQPGRYSLVATARPLITPLVERLAVLPPDLREVWRWAAFMLIAGRSWVKLPMDRNFPFAPPVPEALPVLALRRFNEERDLGAARPGQEDAAPLDATERQALITVFADRTRAEDNAPVLAELIERLRIEHLEQHNPARLLKLMEKAERTMRELAPESLNDRQRNQLRNRLRAIQTQADQLLAAPEPAKAEA